METAVIQHEQKQMIELAGGQHFLTDSNIQNLPAICKREIGIKLSEKTNRGRSERAFVVNKLISSLGINFIDPNEMNLAAAEFGSFIQTYHLTKEEVLEAYRMAARRELFNSDGTTYKVYPNLSIIQCGEILDLYQEFKRNSVERDQALKVIRNQAKSNQPTKEELERIDLEFKQNIFQEIAKSGYSDKADYYFKELKVKGKLRRWSKEQGERFYKMVESNYLKTSISDSLTIGTKSKGFIQELKKSVANGEKRTEIQIKCRAILVSNYLKKNCGSFEEFLKAFG